MRHRVKGFKLNRTKSHRLSLMRNLASALFKHKRIKTTLVKAKAVRGLVDKLITKAKSGTLASRRIVARFIQDKEILKELFSEIIPKVAERPGGYTRIVKIGRRSGDASEMAIFELVDYNNIPSNRKSVSKVDETADAEFVEETEITEDIKDVVEVNDDVQDSVIEENNETENEISNENISESEENNKK